MRSNLGFFLGLTGSRVKGKELVETGLAHYYVTREKLQQLEQDIIKNTTINTKLEDIQALVKKYEEPVKKHYPHEEFINEVFGKGSVEEIYNALKTTTKHKEFADKLVHLMDGQSPLSMRVIHEQIKRGKNLDLAGNLKMDFRLVMR